MKELYKRVLRSTSGVAKTGACQCASVFAGTSSTIARDLGLKYGVVNENCEVVSQTCVCFLHISFAIARASAQEQQELAMCWRWGRVSKTHGSAIDIHTRTERTERVEGSLVTSPEGSLVTSQFGSLATSCFLSSRNAELLWFSENRVTPKP